MEDRGWFTKTTRGNTGLGTRKDINREIALMKSTGLGTGVRF